MEIYSSEEERYSGYKLEWSVRETLKESVRCRGILGMTIIVLRWTLLIFATAGVGFRAVAATQVQCTDLLQTALDDKNPDTRKQAVAALSLTAESGPLFTRLIGMLQDKDVEVREAVVASLAEVRSQSATAALHKALEDEVPEVSFAAAKALWSRRDPAGKTALLAVLEGESKTSSGFFSKQKREALRMMHTPRTAFLFAVRQGVGFAPVPGLGEGVASMQQSSRIRESPAELLPLCCWPTREMPLLLRPSKTHSPTRNGRYAPPASMLSVCGMIRR